jgi:predicted Fe-Mo cluster-binding NifX family protein
MRIAVTSQNRKSITNHAGKCRNFWIYDVNHGDLGNRVLLELPLEQSLHASHGLAAHPLDSVDVLIAGSMGEGLFNRLAEHGVQPVITNEQDPDVAVVKLLMGMLKQTAVGAGCHEHAHSAQDA